MAFDRDRYEKFAKERVEAAHAKGVRPAQILQLVHAAPPMERLTTSNEWNSYISVLQAWLDKANKDRVTLVDSLTNAITIDPMHIAQLKAQINICDGYIKALEQALSLPRQIVDNAKSVEDLLAKLDV